MNETEYRPVTVARLDDLERLSAAHGKFRYCSCMRWRMTSGEYVRSDRDGRARELAEMVRAGTPVGVLAHRGGEPVGWCSVAPRDTYRGLERYRALARVDGCPVWSVACFCVDRRCRREGMTGGLLRAAVEYARAAGAVAVEGYPVADDARLYRYMGSMATFAEAGFVDVAPAGRTRSVMRVVLRDR